MCGYCCGGVPAEKRGTGHAGCSPECHNAPGAGRVARLIRAAKAEAWPCANYTAPVTCLTAPSSETGRCDHCRKEADR